MKTKNDHPPQDNLLTQDAALRVPSENAMDFYPWIENGEAVSVLWPMGDNLYPRRTEGDKLHIKLTWLRVEEEEDGGGREAFWETEHRDLIEVLSRFLLSSQTDAIPLCWADDFEHTRRLLRPWGHLPPIKSFLMALAKVALAAPKTI